MDQMDAQVLQEIEEAVEFAGRAPTRTLQSSLKTCSPTPSPIGVGTG